MLLVSSWIMAVMLTNPHTPLLHCSQSLRVLALVGLLLCEEFCVLTLVASLSSGGHLIIVYKQDEFRTQ